MWCFAGEEQLFMYGQRLTSVVPEGNGNETFFLTCPILILEISTTINSSYVFCLCFFFLTFLGQSLPFRSFFLGGLYISHGSTEDPTSKNRVRNMFFFFGPGVDLTGLFFQLQSVKAFVCF